MHPYHWNSTKSEKQQMSWLRGNQLKDALVCKFFHALSTEISRETFYLSFQIVLMFSSCAVLLIRNIVVSLFTSLWLVSRLSFFREVKPITKSFDGFVLSEVAQSLNSRNLYNSSLSSPGCHLQDPDPGPDLDQDPGLEPDLLMERKRNSPLETTLIHKMMTMEMVVVSLKMITSNMT